MAGNGCLQRLSESHRGMTDTDGYFSLIKRQRRKFEYAETLVPFFAEAASDLGAQRSEGALADWLNERGVKPSANAKEGTKWHRQRLPEILSTLSDPPALDSEQVAGRDLDWAWSGWSRLSDSQKEKLGPRYAVTVVFVKCRSHFEAIGELAREEEKLRKHLRYIESVVVKLRVAFPLAPRFFGP